MKSVKPDQQVFWYLKESISEPLKSDIKTEVVIIGGGMAGLSAAQNFANKGLDVVILEKNFCGAGASGKSSGFITPDSELSLNDFYNIYGSSKAKKIWKFALSGIDLIKQNIKKYNINCDYVDQDTIVLATSQKAFKNDIKKEYQTRLNLGYQSTLYNKDEIGSVINSSKYYGGIKYSGTFGIKAYNYCQAVKEALQKQEKQSIKIYEDTPALEITYQNIVKTPQGSVQAKYIVICADYGVTNLNKLVYEVYHAQTYLMISEPLNSSVVKKIFPDKPLMAWDTDLIYQYFRITGDNRLMLGGASLLTTFSTYPEYNNYKVFNNLYNYFKSKFSKIDMSKISFRYMWPGLIGISKDIIPIAGPDQNQPNIYYVTAAAGLPWAAALGHYSAESLVDKSTEFDEFFNPERDFFIGPFVQKIIGTKLSFAISNFMQVGSF